MTQYASKKTKLGVQGDGAAVAAQSLTIGLGGKWYGRYGAAPCPVCQTERRPDQFGLSLRDGVGTLLLYCHKSGCAFDEIRRALDQPIPPGRGSFDGYRRVRAKQTQHDSFQLQRACLLWKQSILIQGTPGENYLRARGITCALLSTLRWHPNLYHGPSGSRLSAMISLVEPTSAVHRTFFNSDGSRVERAAKMMLGPCAGGAVRLSKGKGPLVVAEGIETGLSLLCGIFDLPATVWAALSTSGMKSLVLPDEPADLIIASDGDDAGHRAAEALSRRAVNLGWQVKLNPAPWGQDWNDVLKASLVQHGR